MNSSSGSRTEFLIDNQPLYINWQQESTNENLLADEENELKIYDDTSEKIGDFLSNSNEENELKDQENAIENNRK